MSTTTTDNTKHFTVRQTWDYSAHRSVFEHVYHGTNGDTYTGVHYKTQEEAQKWADIKNADIASRK